MKRLSKIAVLFAWVGLLFTSAPARADDKVTLEDLPAAAKKTVERETKGATINQIEKESDKAGKPIYEVDYTKDGVEKELKVSNSGAVISRHKD
jgi:hypothetical protein